MHYLVHMFENVGYYRDGSYRTKEYHFEMEFKDDVTESEFYEILAKEHPGLYYRGRSVLKFELPDGWKRIEGALTAPQGYYWANNCKSRFDKDYQSALIKE